MSEKALSCPQCGRRYAEPADRCSVDGSPLYGPEVMRRIGMSLGNYKIHHLVGEGGMGVVYRGEHVMLGKPVAIKILHDRFARRDGAVEQFLSEARAASRIRHPNIVDVTDFGAAPDGSVYFVMEFLEGESLEDVLARDYRMDLFGAINVGRQIANALASAHDHGIVHLDLKPENIYLINRTGRRRVVRRVRDENDKFLVEPEGQFDFVKLLDFGVARFTDEHTRSARGTRGGMVFGTPHYMSPEQAQGRKVDGRSDIYSLGILLYEMILGEVPFDGDESSEILNAHVSQPVIPLKGHSPDVEVDDNTNDTILRCLEKSPDHRFQTMDELIDALQHCFTDRVFLRDAHNLPGAAEAGIIPPPRPTHKRPTPRDRSPAPAEAPVTLTDELTELFATADEKSDDAADAPELSVITTEHTPKTRARTSQPTSKGAGTVPAGERETDVVGESRKTAPLVSKGGADDPAQD